MREIFWEIFWEIGEENGCESWWEVFDSEVFDLVENAIAERLGADVIDSDEFIAWANEMAEDL